MSSGVSRLVETLVRASVGGSTYKVYAGKWKMWVEFMRQKGKGPWLRLTDESEVLRLLLEFMACRLFSFNNQKSTVRGTLPLSSSFTSCTWLGTAHFSLYDSGRGQRDR